MDCPALPRRPTTELTLTTRPKRCFIMVRAAVLQHRKAPFKLVARTASKSSSFIRITRSSRVMPALLTRMSMRPNSFTTPSSRAFTAAASVTSARTPRAGLPRAAQAASVSRAAVVLPA